MQILVTGAGGFIGKRLCQVLAEKGQEVIRVGRGISSPSSFDVGDIGPDTDWQLMLAKSQVVVHLAARVHVMQDTVADPMAEFRRINVESTLNLARQAAAAGIERFVFVSSVKVNGESASASLPFREDDAPAPQDDYALSKYKAELALGKLAQDTGLEIVIVRPPLVYGPGVKGNFATLVSWICKEIPLPLGGVRNRRSLIALENLVDFLALCADRDLSPQAAGQIFLVADGADLSTPELLRKVAHAYGKKSRLVPIPECWLRLAARLLSKSAAADRLLGSLVVDASKARRLLGWHPIVTTDQQLQYMANDATNS